MNAWSAKTFYHDDTTPADGVVSRVFWQGKDDYEEVRNGLLRDFAGAIREKRQPLTGLEQALVVQQITDAIYASAAQGRAVEIV